ncbi:hypothetical protein MNV49_007356 [Pseudohyphozyma bogoriensis]|nr:hypothetical protein MNV49_007356 [Pseudohyphozyma bogoriensis]
MKYEPRGQRFGAREFFAQEYKADRLSRAIKFKAESESSASGAMSSQPVVPRSQRRKVTPTEVLADDDYTGKGDQFELVCKLRYKEAGVMVEAWCGVDGLVHGIAEATRLGAQQVSEHSLKEFDAYM